MIKPNVVYPETPFPEGSAMYEVRLGIRWGMSVSDPRSVRWFKVMLAVNHLLCIPNDSDTIVMLVLNGAHRTACQSALCQGSLRDGKCTHSRYQPS
jgi:hypothetical protein